MQASKRSSSCQLSGKRPLPGRANGRSGSGTATRTPATSGGSTIYIGPSRPHGCCALPCGRSTESLELRQSASSSRSGPSRKCPVSGRSRKHAEGAMTVDPRRRHRRGERSSSLQRRRQQRGDPARTGLGALVEQALGFARPVQGEWRAGAVTQQPPTPRAVSGLGVVKLLTGRRSRRRVEIGCGLPTTTAYELT